MSGFAARLKAWRRVRRLSQLALACEAGISSRHLAFLETGRARPSPAMIGRLGEALRLPLSDRNQLLQLAGFAPRYGLRSWDAAEMAPIRAAVGHMLDNHAPFPALAVDRLWRVVALNAPARILFAPLGVTEGTSLLELMLSPALQAAIENWPEVAHHAALRLRAESAAQGGIARLDEVAAALAAAPAPGEGPAGPVVPTILRAGPERLSLFATIAQFGTAEDITLDDLKIELYFPADATTERALLRLADQAASPAT